MVKTLKELFTDHPTAAGETYFEHMWFAVRYAFQLGLCTMAAIIHSIFPFLLTTYCSKKIAYLNEWVKNRD